MTSTNIAHICINTDEATANMFSLLIEPSSSLFLTNIAAKTPEIKNDPPNDKRYNSIPIPTLKNINPCHLPC